uniref:Cg-BigDef5 n=1 Tax=Magallana gigas TaxID=29159 RepID=A0A9X9ZA81_MAGGI
WAQALLPIWTYTQLTVSAPLFAALVAAYGIYAVTRYGIKKARTRNDSHQCANNRGWCRKSCFGHEYIDWYYTDVCGSFYCCRPRNL